MTQSNRNLNLSHFLKYYNDTIIHDLIDKLQGYPVTLAGYQLSGYKSLSDATLLTIFISRS